MSVSGISSSASSSMMEEMRKKMEAAFQSADTDGDGKLSKTEFATFDATMKANGPGGTSGTSETGSSTASQGPSAEDMFAAMDSDGDGSVTLSEAESFKPPLPPEGMGALLQSQESSSSTDSTSTDSSNLIAQLLQQLLSGYANNSSTDMTSLLSGTSGLSSVTA